jgi:hypothetical protein
VGFGFSTTSSGRVWVARLVRRVVAVAFMAGSCVRGGWVAAPLVYTL